jgi:hypothetical protein
MSGHRLLTQAAPASSARPGAAGIYDAMELYIGHRRQHKGGGTGMKRTSYFQTLSGVDAPASGRYIKGTSLLSVSTAERGADSSEAALAFSIGWPGEKEAAS